MKTLIQAFHGLASLSTLAALLWLAPLVGQAEDYTYITNNGTITITRFIGTNVVAEIPNSISGLPVRTIRDNAFSWCQGLTSVTIPDTVTTIGSWAFSECPSLTSFVVDPGNPAYSSLEGVLFDKAGTTLIQFPAGKAGSYIIASSVTAIADGAFFYCAGLTSVTIPNSVTTIGGWGFYYCTSLTSVTIPNSVTTIGKRAFEHCTNLTSFVVDPGNPAYSSLEGVLFDNARTTLIQFPPGKAGSCTIPNSVTTIQYGAFEDCTSLASVTIGNGLTTIVDWTFESCTSLTSVTIPNSVTAIGEGAFYSTSLTNVTIPNSVTIIGGWAFEYCTNLTSVTIGNSVTAIGAGAFYHCASLTSVTIPNSVTRIMDSAFASCTSLTGAFFNGHAPTTVGSYVFEGNNSATVYYLPGTRGWSATFADHPTAPWFLPHPVILTLPPDFGVKTDAFRFRISWATNASVAVDGCTSILSPAWTPVATNTLVEGWTYFSDPDWTNHPARFYRVRSP